MAGSLSNDKMSKVSINEKCKIMLDIFHFCEGLFYQQKDLEKLSKSQGIEANEVKEILQSLLSDEKIESDKIGSTLFYWSFPVKKIEEDKKKGDELKLKNKELNDKMLSLRTTVKQVEEEKEKLDDFDKIKREELVKNIDVLKAREKDLMEHINSKDNVSIEETTKLKTGVDELTLAVNRWTDNIFNMKTWFKRKYPAIDEAQLEKEFRIPAEFDYFSPN